MVGTFVAARNIEAQVRMGVDVLHGREWTPAFGPGLEARWYPIRQLTNAATVRASFFAEGYPLLDSRIDLGAALGRIDLRLGARWIYQHCGQGATSILGPSVSFLIRLGP